MLLYYYIYTNTHTHTQAMFHGLLRVLEPHFSLGYIIQVKGYTSLQDVYPTSLRMAKPPEQCTGDMLI